MPDTGHVVMIILESSVQYLLSARVLTVLRVHTVLQVHLLVEDFRYSDYQVLIMRI